MIDAPHSAEVYGLVWTLVCRYKSSMIVTVVLLVLQSIPRTIWLDPKTMKNVLQWPVEELEALRGAHASYEDIELKPTEVVKVNGGDGQQVLNKSTS